MMMKRGKRLWELNRVLLGLLMLVPGLLGIFVFTPSGVGQVVSEIFFFSLAPMFWAWVLILSEIVFGVAILANYKLDYVTIPPIIILSVATLAVVINWSSFLETNWSNVLFHLVAISNYVLIWNYNQKR